MLNLNPGSEYGQRVQRRLRDEQVAWLTTVDGAGTPRSVPVWFHWDDEAILIYSQPGQLKLRNIERNPRVNLHLNGDAHGGDIVVLIGEARVAPNAPPATSHPAYLEKYRDGITQIGLNPESFAASYSVPILFTPQRVWGH